MDFQKIYEFYLILYFHRNYEDDLYLNNKGYSLMEVYSYLNQVYQYLCGEELDISFSVNQTKVFDFFNGFFRYTLLNDDIKEAYDELTKDGSEQYLMDHFDTINEKVLATLEMAQHFKDSKCSDLPKMTHDELESLFREFLKYVDPEGDYSQIFEKMQQEGKLIYYDALDEKQKEFFYKCFGIDGKLRNFYLPIDDDNALLFVNREETIGDFQSLAHEFAHYVSFETKGDKGSANILAEFPSIFYELLACSFLLKKGYDSKKVNECYHSRYQEIGETYNLVNCVSRYFKMYRDHGDITRENDIEDSANQAILYIEKYGAEHYKELLKQKPSLANPELMADNYCDLANAYLTRDPNYVGRKYPYIIGLYLATKKFGELKGNPKVLETMKNITMNLSTVDLDSLFLDAPEKR